MPHPLAALNACDRDAFVAALGHLFEHSPWVAAETWPRRPFRDADALHAALCETMRGAPAARQVSISHTPISSPNICETSGAVMKSPASPSAGRVA